MEEIARSGRCVCLSVRNCPACWWFGKPRRGWRHSLSRRSRTVGERSSLSISNAANGRHGRVRFFLLLTLGVMWPADSVPALTSHEDGWAAPRDCKLKRPFPPLSCFQLECFRTATEMKPERLGRQKAQRLPSLSWGGSRTRHSRWLCGGNSRLDRSTAARPPGSGIMWQHRKPGRRQGLSYPFCGTNWDLMRATIIPSSCITA